MNSPVHTPVSLTTSLVQIYVDGACAGNPGPGGWGVLILNENKDDITLSGGESHTTNNRMELRAAIEALKYVTNTMHGIIHTDSQYVKDGITLWIKGWKKNGWKNAKKEPVKNQDLWIELDTLASNLSIEWRWVKGHSGNVYNEKADMLAKKGIIASNMR